MEERYILFLLEEMGEFYQDLIEMDFDMTVEEFCEMFVKEDEDGELYSEI